MPSRRPGEHGQSRIPHAARKACASAAAVLYPSSRYPFTAKGAEAFNLQRPSSSLVQPARDQASGLVSVGLRQFGQVLPVFTSNRKRSELAPARQADAPNGLTEQAVGGFHSQSVLMTTPLSGAFT